MIPQHFESVAMRGHEPIVASKVKRKITCCKPNVLFTSLLALYFMIVALTTRDVAIIPIASNNQQESSRRALAVTPTDTSVSLTRNENKMDLAATANNNNETAEDLSSPLSNIAESPEESAKQQQREETNKRIFVCVTGQRQRLELYNKVKYVFNPLRDSGWDVQIALMLSDNTQTMFTNPKMKEKEGTPYFSTFEDAKNYLQSRNFTVLTEQPVNQTSDPIMGEEYLAKLNKKRMTTENRFRRAQNHIRQFETLTRCGETMLKVAAEASSSSPWSQQPYHYYDLIIRVRDDVGLLEPLQVNNLTNLLFEESPAPRTILSSDCRRWSGMNDRLAFVTPDAAFSYFMSPLMDFYTKPLHVSVNSPERFLFYTYLDEGNHLVHTPNLRGVVRLDPYNRRPEKKVKLQPAEDKPFCPADEGEPRTIFHSPNNRTYWEDRFTYDDMILLLRNVFPSSL